MLVPKGSPNAAMPSKKDIEPQTLAALPESLKAFMSLGKTEFETDEDIWSVKVEKVQGFIEKELPANSIIIANNGYGDRLFLVPKTGSPDHFDSKVYVFWHDELRIAVIADDIDTILNPPPPTPTQRGPVFYHGGQTTVELGDEVIARWFFIRRAGR